MWSPNRRDRAEASYIHQHEQSLLRASTAPSSHHHHQRKSSSSTKQLPPINTAKGASSSLKKQDARSLQIKNEAQRKEREARQKEEAILQERVNDHLSTLLSAHKQHKKDMMSRWQGHANAPMPRAPAPNAVARKREEEKFLEEQERQDRRARAREATRRRLQRGTMLEDSNNNNDSGAMMLMSETSNSSYNNRNESTTSSAFQQQQQQTNQNLTTSSQNQLSEADARATANFQQIAKIYETVLQPQKTDKELEETATEIPLNFTPHTIKDMDQKDDFGPLLVSLTPEQRKRLRDIDKKHEKTKSRLEAQQVMFEKAKQRRKIASDRIREDPPADVLVQADLRRYIPADLLETIPELGGPENNNNNNNNNNTNYNLHLSQQQQNNNNNNSPSFFLTDVNDASLTKKERKDLADKSKEDLKNGKDGKKEKRRQSLAAMGASSSNKKLAAEASTKQKALAGGPLENVANNKRMSIFAREVLMKVATSQALRSEREKTRIEREKEELRQKFLQSGLEPPKSDDDEDDNENDEDQHQQNDNDDDGVNNQTTSTSTKRRGRNSNKQRDLEAHQHDYDHFFLNDNNNDDDQQQQVPSSSSEALSAQNYLKLNIAQEQQAAVEWYRKYHKPLMAGGRKDKSLLGAAKSVGSYDNQTQRVIAERWKDSHKPVEGLPRPSRTLFFDSEKPKTEFRKGLL